MQADDQRAIVVDLTASASDALCASSARNTGREITRTLKSKASNADVRVGLTSSRVQRRIAAQDDTGVGLQGQSCHERQRSESEESHGRVGCRAQDEQRVKTVESVHCFRAIPFETSFGVVDLKKGAGASLSNASRG